MLKKMVIVAAILAMTGTVFGAWSANKFADLPPAQIEDPANPGQTPPVMIDNPAWVALQDAAATGGAFFDRTVDWETDGDKTQRKAESWNWPATYDYIPVCDIRVQMDVGFWIRLDGCRDQIIKLKQRMINQYGGQTTCTAYTNVATEWKADFVKKDGIDLGGYDKKAAVDPSKFESTQTLAAKKQVITIKLKLWDVDLKNLPAGTRCLDIGWVRVSVRPSVRPNAFMSSCDDRKFPVYSPPPTDSSIWW